jgi:hypothetical protein
MGHCISVTLFQGNPTVKSSGVAKLAAPLLRDCRLDTPQHHYLVGSNAGPVAALMQAFFVCQAIGMPVMLVLETYQATQVR